MSWTAEEGEVGQEVKLNHAVTCSRPDRKERPAAAAFT